MVWAPDYVTLVEGKKAVGIGDALDDDVIALIITTASRAVDDHCRRQFGQVAAPEARRYPIEHNRRTGRCEISIDDLMTETGFTVSVGGQTFTADDYRLEAVNAVTKGKPWTKLVLLRTPSIAVTDDTYADLVGKWGWLSVPAQVKVATRMQINRFNARRNSPYGVAGSPNEGSEIRLLAKLDPDVITALGSNLIRW